MSSAAAPIAGVNEDELGQVLAAQRAAFAREPYPDSRIRKDRLHRLAGLLQGHRARIIDALKQDFGCRCDEETRLVEIGGSVGNLHYAAARLRRWMAPRRRSTSIWFLPGRNRILPQPLGVVGVMAPWNYPINLAVSPAAAAIAAGNRVMIKMSEHTPASAAVLSELVASAFDRDELAIFSGDAAQAAKFSELPLDHLLFTGSTAVGRKVFQAAARNLTPVTLELGGKSPVVISDSATLDEAALRIVWGKCFNAGQTCVAPDYLLLPRGSTQELEIRMSRHFKAMFPEGASAPEYTSVLGQGNRERLRALLDEARAAGVRVVPLDDRPQAQWPEDKLPPHLVINPPASLRLMREEIFGPILPVIEVDGLDQAIDHINAAERPLALYYFGRSEHEVDQLLQRTHAGGVTVNDVMLQYLQVSMPFGGVGGSGFGAYHGQEGFDTFSHLKSVFTQRGIGRFTGLKLLYPPYSPIARRLIGLMGG